MLAATMPYYQSPPPPAYGLGKQGVQYYMESMPTSSLFYACAPRHQFFPSQASQAQLHHSGDVAQALISLQQQPVIHNTGSPPTVTETSVCGMSPVKRESNETPHSCSALKGAESTGTISSDPGYGSPTSTVPLCPEEASYSSYDAGHSMYNHTPPLNVPRPLYSSAYAQQPYSPMHYSPGPSPPIGGLTCSPSMRSVVRDPFPRNNSCHICGKTYARQSTLKTHLRSHNGEKPYQCSICQKAFTQAANLTAHLRTHSGEKPFKCPVCQRGFSQSSSVTTHLRTHSGDRPYKCNACGKGFADSSTLTKHYRTHTGEKPYQCKICDARFSQSGNLNRHMRTHRNHFQTPGAATQLS